MIDCNEKEQIEEDLKAWREANLKYGRPIQGWIKTIRCALKMTVQQLADRLGLTRRTVRGFETSEIKDMITLGTLKKVANAMECELIYAFVPKSGRLNVQKKKSRR